MDDICTAITQIMRLLNECLRVSVEFIPLLCHREVDSRDLRATSADLSLEEASLLRKIDTLVQCQQNLIQKKTELYTVWTRI